MEKYLFVSDLHLVDGSGAEDTTDPERFSEFLEVIEKTKDVKLYALGDWIDLNQAFDLKRSENFFKGILDIFRLDAGELFCFIRESHPKLIEKTEILLEKGKMVYIVGNHDPKMQKVWKKYGPKRRLFIPFDRKGNKILAEHGHVYTKSFIIGNSRIEEPGLRILGLLERYLHEDVDVWYGGAEKIFDPEKSERFYRNVRKSLSRRKNVRFHVFGHTHDTYFEQIKNGDWILRNRIDNLPYVREISANRKEDGYSQYIINSGCNVNGHEDAVLIYKYKDKYFVVFDRRDRIVRTKYH